MIYAKELDYKLWHSFEEGAPDDWSAKRGATHTLHTIDGTRPAKLLKTVAYIGIDETDTGDIVWNKWKIRREAA